MTQKPKFLTRDQILAAQDITTEEVDVPEWGGAVRVRGMSGRERDAFEASVVEQPTGNRSQRRNAGRQRASTNMDNLRARLGAWSIVDGNGERLFTDEDVLALGTKSAAGLDRVFEVAMRLSGISETDADELAEAMVDRPFDDSSSPSPES